MSNSIPYRWEYKPPIGSELNPDHPLRPHLAAVVLLNEGEGRTVHNLALPHRTGTIYSGGSNTNHLWTGGNLWFTDGQVDLGSHADYQLAEYTYLFIGRGGTAGKQGSGGATVPVVGQQNNSGAFFEGMYLEYHNGGTYSAAVGNGSSANTNCAVSADTNVDRHIIGVTWKQPTLSIFNCGVAGTTGTMNSSIPWGSNSLLLNNFGTTPTSVSGSGQLARHECFMLLNRALNQGEMFDLCIDPYAVIRAPANRFYSVPAVVGGGTVVPVLMHNYRRRRVA